MIDTVPSINKPAPIFKGIAVINGQFQRISLEDYFGQYVVFFFYPLNFSIVCPTEITAFCERFKHFKKMDTTVIACSTDSQFVHLAWVNTPKEKGGLGYTPLPILSDFSLKISRLYGVLDKETGTAFRAWFIIDGKGLLRQITINDMPVGRNVNEALRLVQALQFAEATQLLCPADWIPGIQGIRFDEEQLKEQREQKKK